MPDLNQLLDALVGDVSAGTRAPGASTAIKRAHRRRTTIAVTAACAAALIAVGGGLAAGTLGDSDERSPTGEPTLPSPEPPIVQESPEPSPGSDEYFETELRRILAQVPNWAVTHLDPTIIAPCGADWSSAATGAGGGSFDVSSPSEHASVNSTGVGFPSAAEAREAVDVLVANLESCKTVAWRTQPIAQTRAVLASSAGGVIWIHQKGEMVSTLEVPTTDGPPPLGVQVEVADLMSNG